jgi:hypothetical protein
MRSTLLLTTVFAAAILCHGRSFDVISTDTGGVEVVMAPIHHGSLLLQFKGKAIYVDPDTKGDYRGMPAADYIFFTAGEKDQPAKYASLRKPSTVVISAPLAERRVFGEITIEPAGGGFVFNMAGRRFYVTGNAAPTAVPKVDAAFVCLSVACAENAAATVNKLDSRVVFPYRYGNRNLQGLKSTARTEIRRRQWY